MPVTRLFLLIVICFSSCQFADKTSDKPEVDNGTYFSIKQFVKDQWDTYEGQPFGIVKKVRLNGKTDSSMLNAYDMDWAPVFRVFFDTDISDPKFLGQYDFTMFEDNTTDTRNFFYEAKSDELYTRKLQISADALTNKIRSIYIETVDNQNWHNKTRKLFYIPIKVITIQEYEKATPGPDKEMIIEYRFL